MKALCAAAKRGATIRLMVDAHAFMLGQGLTPGPLLFSKKLNSPSLKLFTTKHAWLEKLAACGGEYTITNLPTRPFTNPFGGRSHIKFAVVNDDIYIGGCNLKGEDRIDLMCYWQQTSTANWLFELAGKVHSKNQLREVVRNTDQTLAVDNQTSLLVDAGLKNQSLIFENALRIIDEAAEYIIMTCQYPPNGVTAKHLSKAVQRGVQVRLIHNHPSKHPFPMNLLHTAVKYFEKGRNPSVLFKYELSKDHDYLHAKLLATEQACMIGSHNYVQAGVRFGTAEIALLSTNSDFAKQAVKALEKQV